MGFLKSFILAIALLFIAGYYSIKVLFRWGDTSLNREFLQVFCKFSIWVIGLKVEYEHPERINARRPAVLIGNHQTGMDLGVIGILCPTDTVIIGKREIIYMPFLGWFLLGAGNLLINRSKSRKAREALFGVIDTLKEKNLNLAMMPEGTRNRVDTRQLLPFKKGAFNLAIEAQLPIIPVLCSSLEGIAIWEKNQFKPGKVIISVMEPVETKGMQVSDALKLSQDVWTMMDAELKRINAKVGA